MYVCTYIKNYICRVSVGYTNPKQLTVSESSLVPIPIPGSKAVYVTEPFLAPILIIQDV